MGLPCAMDSSWAPRFPRRVLPCEYTAAFTTLPAYLVCRGCAVLVFSSGLWLVVRARCFLALPGLSVSPDDGLSCVTICDVLLVGLFCIRGLPVSRSFVVFSGPSASDGLLVGSLPLLCLLFDAMIDFTSVCMRGCMCRDLLCVVGTRCIFDDRCIFVTRVSMKDPRHTSLRCIFTISTIWNRGNPCRLVILRIWYTITHQRDALHHTGVLLFLCVIVQMILVIKIQC